MSFISDAYAQVTQNAPATGDNPLMSFLPLILIFGVFYIFLIRPEQKKRKEHETFLTTMKIGDEVVTGGGIIGKVKKVEEGSNIVYVEIAKDVVVRVNKSTIIDILAEVENDNDSQKNNPQSNDTKKDKKTKASA